VFFAYGSELSGGGWTDPDTGGTVSSAFDHRIAMALVAAGLASEGEVVVTDAQCADVSFPGFFSKLAACKADLSIVEASD
jgi:3-phosphoshikimate 1-carboxyvinyltransferase